MEEICKQALAEGINLCTARFQKGLFIYWQPCQADTVGAESELQLVINPHGQWAILAKMTSMWSEQLWSTDWVKIMHVEGDRLVEGHGRFSCYPYWGREEDHSK